jgi:hypothetical protein
MAKEHQRLRIMKATLDGFQSTDTMQQFNKKKIITDYLSVDKDILPYHDLREAIYEGRCRVPEVHGLLEARRHCKPGRDCRQELLQLIEKENGKIDHPEGGSKDVSDAMAGVVTTLMGDRTYRRGVGSPASSSPTSTVPSGGIEVPGFKLECIPWEGCLAASSAPSMPDPTLGRWVR